MRFEVTALTTTRDRTCQALTECDPAAREWERVGQTATTDRICSNTVRQCRVFAAADNTTCSRCDPGFWRRSLYECAPCPVGHACAGLVLEPCAAGSAQPLAMQDACIPCVNGTIQVNMGQPKCAPCLQDKYQPSAGQTECLTIAPGYYPLVQSIKESSDADSGDGVLANVGIAPCEAGTACSAGVAVSCPAGTYSSPKSAKCTTCGPAGYSSEPESAECIAVVVGWYSTGPGGNVSTGTEPCPTGSYCRDGVRRECPLGTFQDVTVATACKPCGVGHYSNVTGRVASCPSIAHGFYGIGGTASTRQQQAPCPAGSYCVDGVRINCPLDTYRTQLLGTNPDDCDPCTSTCPAGTSHLSPRCDLVTGEARCVDLVLPSVTLQQPNRNPYYVELGMSVFADPGAVCTDTHDGEISPVSSDASATVMPNQSGSYTVTYTCTDAANLSSTVARSVIVRDTIAPVLTLKGREKDTVVEGGMYKDPGVAVVDAGDPSVSVTVAGWPLPTNLLGTFALTYRASDASGNEASPVQRLVTILPAEAEADALLAARVAYGAVYSKNETGLALALQAASRAYVLVGGGGDPMEAAQAAARQFHASQLSPSESTSSNDSSASSTTLGLGIVAGLMLVIIIVLVLRRPRSTSSKHRRIEPADYITNEAYIGGSNSAAGQGARVLHADWNSACAPEVDTRKYMSELRNAAADNSGSAPTSQLAHDYMEVDHPRTGRAAGNNDYLLPKAAAAETETYAACSGSDYVQVTDDEPTQAEYCEVAETSQGGDQRPPAALPRGHAEYATPLPAAQPADMTEIGAGFDEYAEPFEGPRTAFAAAQMARGGAAAEGDGYEYAESATTSTYEYAEPPTASSYEYSALQRDTEQEYDTAVAVQAKAAHAITPSLAAKAPSTERSAYTTMKLTTAVVLESEEGADGETDASLASPKTSAYNRLSLGGGQDTDDESAVKRLMPQWLQATLSRDKAREYLSDRPVGSFIVRKSSQEGCFALTLKVSSNKVRKDPEKTIGRGGIAVSLG